MHTKHGQQNKTVSMLVYPSQSRGNNNTLTPVAKGFVIHRFCATRSTTSGVPFLQSYSLGRECVFETHKPTPVLRRPYLILQGKSCIADLGALGLPIMFLGSRIPPFNYVPSGILHHPLLYFGFSRPEIALSSCI